ncbi:MAG: T9SS type A sorting domain-containing protein [Saprospiraceae bacterium]|nr:T9SS type A sorting domain-containing protein [Saprospiraceae bacterium]
MQKTVLLYFALLFWFVVPVKAQLTFFVEDYSAKNGDFVDVPIVIENFDSIFTFQFTFSWDPTVVKYLGAVEPDITNWNIATYNDNTSPEGFVRAAWFDDTLVGVNLPDGDSLITMTFEVIGEPGDSTLFAFPQTPLPPQYGTVSDTSPQVPDIQEGKLNVMFDVSTHTPEDYGWIIKPASPNPFRDQTSLEFTCPKASAVSWSLFNTNGKLIKHYKGDYPAGVNHFVLEQQLLNENGLYFLRLETADFIQTQKIEFFK